MNDFEELARSLNLEAPSSVERTTGAPRIYRLTPDLEKVIVEYEAKAAEQGSIPLVYDHSMYSTMQSCDRKGFLQYVMHLKPLTARQHPLSFGTAIHTGLEVINKLRTSARVERREQPGIEELKQKALQAYVDAALLDPTLPRRIHEEPPYKPQSVQRGYNLLAKYIEERPEDNDLWVVESPEDVEVGFAILIGGFIFVGKIDLIVRMKRNGRIAIVDHKTTTKMTELYGNQWNPFNALTGYMHAASEMRGEKIRDAYINCLYFNKNIEEVNRIFPTTRTDRDVEDWIDEVQEVMALIQERYNKWRQKASTFLVEEGTGKHLGTEIDMSLGSKAINVFPKNTGHCHAYYRECVFKKICRAGNALMRDKIAAADFEVKQWLPFEELQNKEVEGD